MLDREWRQKLDEIGQAPDIEAALNELASQINNSNCHKDLKRIYLSAIDNELEKFEIKARTVLDKEYPTREAAEAAKNQYNRIKAEIASAGIRENAFLIRAELLKADFSENIRKELLDELFHAENSPEIKATRTISNIATLALLIIIVVSYLLELSCTLDFSSKRVVLFGNDLLINDAEIDGSMNFIDGAKNGLIIFGRSIGGIFTNGVNDYFEGFSGKGLITGTLWAILGLIWVIIKEVLLCFARYFVSLVLTFFQKAGFTYYLGYLIGSAVPLAISNLIFDKDTPVENVQRLKGWSVKKVILTVLIVLSIGIISLAIFVSEL